MASNRLTKRPNGRETALFYEEFEDVCALANNCKGMSYREQLLALRARCRGMVFKISLDRLGNQAKILKILSQCIQHEEQTFGLCGEP